MLPTREFVSMYNIVSWEKLPNPDGSEYGAINGVFLYIKESLRKLVDGWEEEYL
jgi:hypothetical protein